MNPSDSLQSGDLTEYLCLFFATKMASIIIGLLKKAGVLWILFLKNIFRLLLYLQVFPEIPPFGCIITI
jgi:hypothetical protein